MSLCKDCVRGVRLDGPTEGKLEKVGGVDAYIAIPTGDYPKDAVILFLSDIFGIQLPNGQLLADDFARNGFKVVMPDLFNGDPVTPDFLTGGAPDFDLQAWLKNHGQETVKPLVTAVYAALRQEGVTKFYLTGYCFGARVAFDLAFKGLATAISAAHPAFVKVPEDFEKYKSVATAPLLINGCEFDDFFLPEDQVKADEIMTDFAPGYKRIYWEGVHHGFASRGDMADPKVKAAKEGAFESTVLWFRQHK